MGAFVWLARRLVYPGILGGSALGVALLSERVAVVVAMGVVNVLAGAAILAVEAALPYRRVWQGVHGDVKTDLGYLAMTGVALVLAGTPLMAAFGAAAAWLGQQGGGALWPSHWPRLLQLPLALLVYELGSYSFHRLCHHSRLWRLHSVHHSVRRLHGLNAIRSHPFDLLLAVATTSGPLLLLGVDERLFAQVTVIGHGEHVAAARERRPAHGLAGLGLRHPEHPPLAPLHPAARAAAQPGRQPGVLGRRVRHPAGAARSRAARTGRHRPRPPLPRRVHRPAAGPVHARRCGDDHHLARLDGRRAGQLDGGGAQRRPRLPGRRLPGARWRAPAPPAWSPATPRWATGTVAAMQIVDVSVRECLPGAAGEDPVASRRGSAGCAGPRCARWAIAAGACSCAATCSPAANRGWPGRTRHRSRGRVPAGGDGHGAASPATGAPARRCWCSRTSARSALPAARRALLPLGYREVAADPVMVLPIRPEWRTFEDYLAALKARYRGHVRRALARFAGDRAARAGRRTRSCRRPPTIDALHAAVLARASIRPSVLDARGFAALRAAAGRSLRLRRLLPGAAAGRLQHAAAVRRARWRATTSASTTEVSRQYSLYRSMLYDDIAAAIAGAPATCRSGARPRR